MTNINRVILIGRLTRDVETKYTPNGTMVAKFSIAVNSSYKSGDEWKEEAHFFNLTMWGKRAESLAQYMVKGLEVAVDGSLRQNRWADKDGQAHSNVEVNVENINLLRRPGGPDEQREPARKDPPRAKDQAGADDEAPF